MSDATRLLKTLRDSLDQVLKAHEKALSTTDPEQHRQAVNELDDLRRKILPRPNDGSRLVDLIADPIVRVSPERYENTIRAAADMLVALLIPWLVPGIPRENDPTTWERYEQSVQLYQKAFRVAADLKSVIRVLDTGNDKLTPTHSTTAPPASEQQTEGEKLDTQPAKQLLHGWRAIEEALGLSQIYPNMNYDERRRKLAYLNRRFGGPIKAGGKGSQPVVNRSKLIEWWNSLEEHVERLEERIRDKKATMQSRHPYGRTSHVVPEIGGSVKRRKSRSQT